MLFDLCNGSKQQGNVGHAAALFYYSSLGWNVSNPITDCTDYDFLAEDNGVVYKIQVKTTRFMKDSGNYEVSIVTSGGNQKECWRKELDKESLDYLFVLVENGDCYSIPINEISSNTTITLGDKYERFKVLEIHPPGMKETKEPKEKIPKYFCIECGAPVSKEGGLCKSCSHKKSYLVQRKVERPSKEVLLQQVKEQGMTKTGAIYGVSDKSISHWLEDYKLPGTIRDLKLQGYI